MAAKKTKKTQEITLDWANIPEITAAGIPRTLAISALNPPSLIVRALEREEIETVGELIALDPEVLSTWHGVGKKKIRLITQLREICILEDAQKGGEEPMDVLLTKMQAQGIPLEAHWHVAVRHKRIFKNLKQSTVNTLRQLISRLSTRPETLGLGRSSKKQLWQILEEVAEKGLAAVYGEAIPHNLHELLAAVEPILGLENAQVLRAAFIDDKTKEEIAEFADLSVHSVVGAVNRQLKALRLKIGPEAESLCRPLWEAFEEAGGIIGPNTLRTDFDLSLGEAYFLMKITRDSDELERWHEMLINLSQGIRRQRFEKLASVLRKQAHKRHNLLLHWDTVQWELRKLGFDFTDRDDLKLFVNQALEIEGGEEGIVVEQGIEAELSKICLEFAELRNKAELTESILERSPELFSDLAPSAVEAVIRRAIESHDEIWPVGKGTFLHQDHMRLTPAEILALAREALPLLEGLTTRINVTQLIQQLGEDRFEKIDPITFWFALSRQPEVVAFPGSMLVGDALSYRSSGRTLEDLLREKLNGKLLSIVEIEERMSSRLSYSIDLIREVLTQASWSLPLGPRFMDRQLANITDVSAQEFVGRSRARLARANEPLHVNEIWKRVLKSVPGLAFTPHQRVRPQMVLRSLLAKERGVLVSFDHHVALVDSVPGRALLDQVISETKAATGLSTPEELWKSLKPTYGHTISLNDCLRAASPSLSIVEKARAAKKAKALKRNS